ncbi:hypothetical protein PsorP6_007632 [Peronosclerospora sorghi]|uniref:Uncharacterized protein n=1 Tax=Peronosclerospora sorghi TaxID=230839 RepID=A0ACC0W9Q9_9STRA|nr:hypothetical protein PsorP6_007632 [Peronosclerospora sorghi]
MEMKRKKKHQYNGNKHATDDSSAVVQQICSVKSQTNAIFSLTTSSNPNPKKLGPFSDRQRILIVGDGDFSFSLSLAVFLGGKNLVATCYDSKSDLNKKYSNALLNADALETAGAEVHFNVNATCLEKESWISNTHPYHSIVFNFPHVGGGTEADVTSNQKLLRDFFYSTRKYLHPTRGQVLVSLRNTLFYNRWKIQEQAKMSGFNLKRTELFDASIYSGYEPQRTYPALIRAEPPSTAGAKYFVFILAKSIEVVRPRQKASRMLSDVEGACVNKVRLCL